MMIKVGDKWEHMMLFGWATIDSEIIFRDGNTCVERQEWNAEDTGKRCSCEETREILTDENGREYIVYNKYHGEEFRYYGEED